VDLFQRRHLAVHLQGARLKATRRRFTDVGRGGAEERVSGVIEDEAGRGARGRVRTSNGAASEEVVDGARGTTGSVVQDLQALRLPRNSGAGPGPAVHGRESGEEQKQVYANRRRFGGRDSKRLQRKKRSE